MKARLLQRKTMFVLVGLLVALLVVSCSPNANEPIISPQLGTILAAREAGAEVAVLPTPTPVLISTLTEEQQLAGLPDDVMAAVQAADPSQAEAIALQYGCVGCHSLDPDQQMTGPTWYHVGDTAVARVPDESPGLYIYRSIVAPNDFVVPNFQANLMPQTFAETLSTQELGDLIAFLLEQHQ